MFAMRLQMFEVKRTMLSESGMERKGDIESGHGADFSGAAIGWAWHLTTILLC